MKFLTVTVEKDTIKVEQEDLSYIEILGIAEHIKSQAKYYHHKLLESNIKTQEDESISKNEG